MAKRGLQRGKRITRQQNSEGLERSAPHPLAENPAVSVRSSLKTLLHLGWRHPLLLLILCWVSTMGISTAAIISLVRLSPERTLAPANPAVSTAASAPGLAAGQPSGQPSVQPSAQASAQAAAPQATLQPSPAQRAEPNSRQPSNASLSFLSLVAIAMSCAGGCLVLSQVLKLMQNPRPVKRLTHRPAPQPVSTPVSSPQTIYRARAAKAAQPPVSISFPQALESPKTAAESQPAAIVVPAEQSHPLDWDEPSLADSLDLRQRRPLSHWL